MMLLAGFLLPPLAWLLDLQISYAMVKWACENDRSDLVLLMPLGSLALLGVGTWLSWSCWAALRAGAQSQGGRLEDRSYFVAVSGLAMSAVFGLLILTSVIPRYVLSPCE
jgi:hypothetical protein